MTPEERERWALLNLPNHVGLLSHDFDEYDTGNTLENDNVLSVRAAQAESGRQHRSLDVSDDTWPLAETTLHQHMVDAAAASGHVEWRGELARSLGIFAQSCGRSWWSVSCCLVQFLKNPFGFAARAVKPTLACVE